MRLVINSSTQWLVLLLPVTIPAGGSGIVTIDVATVVDSTYEGTETFTVNLGSITGAGTGGTLSGTGTILDADTETDISLFSAGG